MLFLLFILGPIFLYSISQDGFYCGLNINNMGKNLGWFVLGTFSGSFIGWIICRLLSSLPYGFGVGIVLRYIARNAIIILPMHWWIYYLCKAIWPECPLVISTIVVIILCIMSVEWAKCRISFLANNTK